METWDLYGDDRVALGKTARRGDALPPGANHLIVEIWTVNSRGEVLLTLRDDGKKYYPEKWENTGGAVLAGEDSLHGALRELREETGIVAGDAELRRLGGYRVPEVFADVYLLRRDVRLQDLSMQPGETVAARWVTLAELRRMWARGETAFPTEARLRFIEDALEEAPPATTC